MCFLYLYNCILSRQENSKQSKSQQDKFHLQVSKQVYRYWCEMISHACDYHGLSSGPLVTLDVWRKIKEQSDSNSRQVSLLWTPVRF